MGDGRNPVSRGSVQMISSVDYEIAVIRKSNAHTSMMQPQLWRTVAKGSESPHTPCAPFLSLQARFPASR